MNMNLFGEHAVFIWSAYGITLLILGWTALVPVVRRRRLENAERRRADESRS